MKSRDARTFEKLVLCHLDLVYRVAMKLTGDQHEAEDLVQETYLRAHASFARFELREYGARPWLLKILQNAFFSRCAQAKRAPSLLEDLSLDDIATDLDHNPLPTFPAGTVDWDQFDEELKLAVLELSPKYRTVIVLWALADLSYKEMAEALGCAMGTVMSRLYRARQKLGKELSVFAVSRRIKPIPEVNNEL